MGNTGLIPADRSFMVSSGSLKVETPNGVFLIQVKVLDPVKNQYNDMCTAFPRNHVGKKKVLAKRSKGLLGHSVLSLTECKTAKLQ